MYTQKVFKVKAMVKWTRFKTLLFISIITIFVALYYFFELAWLKKP
jgi:putative membrane protein